MRRTHRRFLLSVACLFAVVLASGASGRAAASASDRAGRTESASVEPFPGHISVARGMGCVDCHASYDAR